MPLASFLPDCRETCVLACSLRPPTKISLYQRSFLGFCESGLQLLQRERQAPYFFVHQANIGQ